MPPDRIRSISFWVVCRIPTEFALMYLMSEIRTSTLRFDIRRASSLSVSESVDGEDIAQRASQESRAKSVTKEAQVCQQTKF